VAPSPATPTASPPGLPAGGARVGTFVDAAVDAGIVEVDGRPVCLFEIAGGPHHGAITSRSGRAVIAAVRLALEMRTPIVGVLDTSGAEVGDGVAALHAWGSIARELASASGVVPTVLVLVGPCVSGPALLLGVADVVVMTTDAFAYVTGPDAIRDFTGVSVDRSTLGGAGRHATTSGVAALVAPNRDAALESAWEVLSYLPDHHLGDPPIAPCDDPVDRDAALAARTVPDRPAASYDMRTVLADVVDQGSLLELRAQYAPNVVTALARLGGHPIGVVANQPLTRAGTLDIDASTKAARFVAWCDAFHLPIVTFVDTPGFEPGRDLEWRGMIRHGAELVHAYCAATVPRMCVVVRKAYGGAYIVMDSRGVGNDLCIAWPCAEIAVMGAAGAVQVLHGRRLRDLEPAARAAEEGRLVEEYEAAFLNPYRAAERGVVDAVVEPADTRRILCDALGVLATKRVALPPRKHSNTPL
jgi:acetyl-CoA carboxylase carboxyltransferase component